jgi:hypothetical protein
MSTTYRITYLLGLMDNTVSPPPVVAAIFPAYDGTQLVVSDQSEITVTFDTPQTPVDLGPLVKVEIVPSL